MLPYSNTIWQQISDQLEGKITAQTLYVNIYQDRHSWQTNLKKTLGFTERQHASDSCHEIDEEESNGSLQSSDTDNSEYEGK